MVFRVDSIEKRLLRLEEVISDLAELAAIDREALRASRRDRLAAERSLQLGAEIIFDIGNHILSAQYGVSPENYEDILEQLSRQGIFGSVLRERLHGLGGFRNLLVHDYLRLDPERVFDFLARAPVDFSEFQLAIRAWLKGREVKETRP